ncbi:hypothetical protein [Actinocrispum wychmicini]|uniref:Uncharacterized protein n=1 Tax=Actinocrispum wychmicini TaxID=1213861 RepID=A0A4R2JKX9_9PSEU|nr:hypothetical protein [Actinocrispum wychmicini]TCO57249.1 hypothetical protein EV192_106726 [Actinocrispum wychmicini]
MEPFVTTQDPRRWNRGFFAACIAIPFTLMQIWAVTVVLTTANMEGAAGFAFLLAVGGSAVAVLDGWRWAWRLGRDSADQAAITVR